MKNGFKLFLITIPLAAIGAGILAYIVNTSPPPAQKPVDERAIAVRAVTVQTQTVSPNVSGFGLVTPARTFEAVMQVGGTVEYVNPDLQKGAILPAGAVLVRVSPLDFNLAIAQAHANIRATKARLAELAVSEANQTSALAIERQALALKANDLERTEALFAGGTVSQSSLDAKRAAHLVQSQKVLAIESSLALLPTQRAVQMEQVTVYEASLKTAELNLARTELTLPFAARVSAATVETGQFVRVGQTAAMLDGIDAAEVTAQISIGEIRRLLQSTHPDTAKFTADPTLMGEVLRSLDISSDVRLSLGQEVVHWPATMDRMSDTIDQKTGTLGVIVRVDTAYSGAEPGARPPLTKGMFVEVRLSGAPISGIIIPRSALRDGQVLVADDDNRLTLVAVQPYLIQNGIAVITRGLAPGQRVVVSHPSPAMAGMLLDVVEDTDLMARLLAEGQK